MDTVTLSHILEPFFTTKEVGRGTGLGLATVYGIVKQHLGWIEVTSQPGIGTSFCVLLPVHQGSGPVSRQTEFAFRPDPRTPPSATILVVEDEEPVRTYVRTVLMNNSFRVLDASYGVQALKVWSDHGGAIDLLFTDMVMPNGISGRALAEQLRQEAPQLKVICTNGYSSESLCGGWMEAPGFRFLPKPSPPQALVKAIREHLGSRQAQLAP